MSFEATPKLASGLRVNALLRLVSGDGGFGAVLAKGHPVAGDIALVVLERGGNPRLLVQMPRIDGSRGWEQDGKATDRTAIDAALERRRQRDPDLWIVELDVANAERLIVLLGEQS